MALEAKTVSRQLKDAGYDGYTQQRIVDYDVSRRRISVFNGTQSVEQRVLGERQRGFTVADTDAGVLVRFSGRIEDEGKFLADYARALKNFGHAVETVDDLERGQRRALLVTEGGG